MNKKIIVLGSDLGTIDIVKEAKKIGLYVIVTDLMKTSPTKEAADEAWMISTTDIDLLEKKCREEKIIAAMAGASDFNNNCVRELCKRLSLPMYCKSDYAWAAATNKNVFKKICKEAGAPVAKDYEISEQLTDEELDKICFPVVVKPVDGSGNSGVSYCQNKEELRNAYKYAKRISENDTILVERQLHGPEWTVNYALADGEIHLLYFSREHHQSGEPANLYSLMNTSSCYLQQYIEEMNDKVIEVFKRAGYTDGIAWVETMLDEDGHFYLIENGHRYGSDMTYTFYENIIGFNSVRWMLEASMGIRHTKEELPQPLTTAYQSTTGSYHLFAAVDGTVTHIGGLDKIEKMPNVITDIPKREGNIVKYHGCMGTIRIYGDTCDVMLDTLREINTLLEIQNEKGENMFIRFTDYDFVREEFLTGLKQFGVQY